MIHPQQFILIYKLIGNVSDGNVSDMFKRCSSWAVTQIGRLPKVTNMNVVGYYIWMQNKKCKSELVFMLL